ncbi:uncharacterized protein LOC107041111 [Diachasma alloeum]|uniref:uncharacterized protein LOC107041111 n=1 Tax=Diachasma alloeum TaxID=454923 RepID=UPI0007383017|nr:uncharacterized protein LOC107041111 [Diachasma alloeum]XP_015116995.1 uncharacterized protein LOC107041111 [Diachasma alloeum]
MEKSDYSIRLASPEDLPQVLDLMRENFYFEENMCKSLCEKFKITDAERRIITEISDGSVRAISQASTCFLAVHNVSRRIVGANLTLLSENPLFGEGKDALADIFPSDGPKSPLIDEYHKYLMDINDRADLFNRYPDARTTMEFYAIAVDKAHGRKGIARELIASGISWAGAQGIPLIFGVFTSPFSKRSAERAGMRSILGVDLLEYEDLEGTRTFEGIGQNNIVDVMVREI